MYDNNMQIILSKVVSDNENAPDLRVNLEIDGTKYKAGLWLWTRKDDGSKVTDKNGNAKYKGKLEVDTYQEQNTPPASTPVQQEDFDDNDIPF